MIELTKIRTDGGTQSRAAINDETVADYAEAMADPNTVFPPVIVYHDGRDYWLADGFHRLAAWERVGRVEVPAEVRQGDRRRAVLHACGANAAHGLRRTNADKRRAVITLLEDAEWSQWPDRQIARQCGVTHPFVAKLRAELRGPDQTESGNGYHPERYPEPSVGSSRDDEPSPVRKPSDTSEADKAGTSVADTAADGPAPDDEPHDPVHAAKLDADAAEPEDSVTAKLRREARKLSRDALEDEWVSLLLAVDEQKAKRKQAEHERDEYKARLDEALAGDDMGRALGNAQRQRDTARQRMKDEQAKNAVQQRRINKLEAEVKKLRKELEMQEVEL